MKIKIININVNKDNRTCYLVYWLDKACVLYDDDDESDVEDHIRR